MITTQAQIKVNLPIELKEYLESKASKFGMPLAGYIKHLILKDVEHLEYPEYYASSKTIAAYNSAQDEQHANKITIVDDIDDFFKDL